MKPGLAFVAAICASLWGLSIIVGYFVLGVMLGLAWPYWAFGWVLALILLLLPQTMYSTVVGAQYRNPSRRGAMRSLRNADRD